MLVPHIVLFLKHIMEIHGAGWILTMSHPQGQSNMVLHVFVWIVLLYPHFLHAHTPGIYAVCKMVLQTTKSRINMNQLTNQLHSNVLVLN